MYPLQGASFLSTPLQGGILKPPALRVVADFSHLGLSMMLSDRRGTYVPHLLRGWLLHRWRRVR